RGVPPRRPQPAERRVRPPQVAAVARQVRELPDELLQELAGPVKVLRGRLRSIQRRVVLGAGRQAERQPLRVQRRAREALLQVLPDEDGLAEVLFRLRPPLREVGAGPAPAEEGPGVEILYVRVRPPLPHAPELPERLAQVPQGGVCPALFVLRSRLAD